MSNEGRYLIGNLFAISNSQKIWRFVDVMVTLHVIQGVTPFKVTSAITSLMPKLPCINIYAVTVHWTTVYDIKCSTQICICVLYIYFQHWIEWMGNYCWGLREVTGGFLCSYQRMESMSFYQRPAGKNTPTEGLADFFVIIWLIVQTGKN